MLMPKQSKQDQGYFFIIPTVLVEQGDHIKALLYGLISSLANKEGYCWATNKYLAEKLGRKDDSIISKKVKELEDEQWIDSEVEKNAGNQRKIYLKIGQIPRRKKQDTSSEISAEVVGNNRRPSSEITEHNSIREKYKKKDKVILRAEARQVVEVDQELIEETNDPVPGLAKRAGDKLSKDIDEKNGVNVVLEIFYRTVNPAINYGNKTSRAATEWLIKKYGLEKTIKMTEFACSIQGQPYTPTITTPYQLKENLGKLVIYYQKQSQKPMGVLKI